MRIHMQTYMLANMYTNTPTHTSFERISCMTRVYCFSNTLSAAEEEEEEEEEEEGNEDEVEVKVGEVGEGSNVISASPDVHESEEGNNDDVVAASPSPRRAKRPRNPPISPSTCTSCCDC